MSAPPPLLLLQYLSHLFVGPRHNRNWDRFVTDTERLINTWNRRYPSTVDPVHVWDDVVSNRSFFLKRLSTALTSAAGAPGGASGASGGGLPLTSEHKQRLLSLQQKVTSANVAGYLRAAKNMAKTGNPLVAKHYLTTAGEENKCTSTQQPRCCCVVSFPACANTTCFCFVLLHSGSTVGR